MAFELYQRQRAVSEEESVSVSAAGVLALSPSLTDKHFKEVDYVQLYFDPATKRVAIKPAKKGEKYSYRVIRVSNGRRAAVSGRGFLRNYKIQNTKDKGKFVPGKFKAKFDNGMIVFDTKGD